MKIARMRSVRTRTDRQGTHGDYTMIITGGNKGRGKELGRVHVWGDSPISEEQATLVAIEIAKEKGYQIHWETA